jgi:hypothetical protein
MAEPVLDVEHHRADPPDPRIGWPVAGGPEANLQTFPDDIAFLTTLALRASAYGQPALVAASHQRHLDAMAAYGELYSTMLTAPLVCRAPRTVPKNERRQTPFHSANASSWPA